MLRWVTDGQHHNLKQKQIKYVCNILYEILDSLTKTMQNPTSTKKEHKLRRDSILYKYYDTH